MIERTEDSGLAGVLLVVMDGRPRQVPVLKLKHSRAWKERLGQVVNGVELDDDLAVTIGRVANLASDVALDLVVAYDQAGVFGGREAIEEAATDRELFDALEAMIRATFPKVEALRSVVEAFGPQLREVARVGMAAIAARLSRASSTPMPSANGDSTPTPLRSVTPTSSSSSSGPTTRSGRGANRRTAPR